MKTIYLPGLCVFFFISGCTPTVYEKQVVSLAAPLKSITTASTTFQAQNKAVSTAMTSVAHVSALLTAEPLSIQTDCKAQADAAASQAVAAVKAKASLDDLYAANQIMRQNLGCSVDVVAPSAKVSEADATLASYNGAEAEVEAATDEASCLKRTRNMVHQPTATDEGQTANGGQERTELTAVWSAIEAYANGLDDVSSAENAKSFSAAQTNAKTAIAAASKDVKSKTFGPAVNLLFAVFDTAVQQDRYETLKTAVICANPLFIRFRSPMRDAMRFQQISAFQSQATRFQFKAEVLRKWFDPAQAGEPCAQASTNALSAATSKSHSKSRRSKKSTRAAPPIEMKSTLEPPASNVAWQCATGWAREVASDPKSSQSDRILALQYLQTRATRLEPQLTSIQAEAAATIALRSADPAPAIDAFIAAHRALRASVVNNDAQLKAAKAALDNLYKAAKALDEALKPAAPSTATTGA